MKKKLEVLPLPALTASLVNTLLGIKPLAKLLKWQARNMMIKQAEKIGVSWRETVNQLRQRNWQEELNQVKNSQLTYPHWLQVREKDYLSPMVDG